MREYLHHVVGCKSLSAVGVGEVATGLGLELVNLLRVVDLAYREITASAQTTQLAAGVCH